MLPRVIPNLNPNIVIYLPGVYDRISVANLFFSYMVYGLDVFPQYAYWYAVILNPYVTCKYHYGKYDSNTCRISRKYVYGSRITRE